MASQKLNALAVELCDDVGAALLDCVGEAEVT